MESTASSAYLEAEESLLTHYGLTARSHYFDLPDPRVRTRVIEVGEGDPVLMVHGGGGVASQWVPLMARLTGKKMFAVDRPGHGLSGPFNYRGSDLRTHAFSFLEAILDALQIDCAPVVANSMGGLWTLLPAINRPQRVSSMALPGCPALMLDTSAPFGMRLLGVRGLISLMWSMQKPSVKMIKRIHKMMGHDHADLDRLPDEFWQAMLLSGVLSNYKEAWLTLLERVVSPFGARRGMSLCEDDLRGVKQPTLLVWGDNDAFGKPPIGDRAASIMPDARVRHVRGGHLPWLDEPETVGSIVQSWLDEQGGMKQ